MKNPKSLGVKIRLGRAFRGLSQRDLAAKIGISQPSLSVFERGLKYPSGATLGKIGLALGESVDFLLEIDPMAGPVENLLGALGDGLSDESLEALGELDDAGLERLVALIEIMVAKN